MRFHTIQEKGSSVVAFVSSVGDAGCRLRLPSVCTTVIDGPWPCPRQHWLNENECNALDERWHRTCLNEALLEGVRPGLGCRGLSCSLPCFPCGVRKAATFTKVQQSVWSREMWPV